MLPLIEEDFTDNPIVSSQHSLSDIFKTSIIENRPNGDCCQPELLNEIEQ